jgi:hypothetical protein
VAGAVDPHDQSISGRPHRLDANQGILEPQHPSGGHAEPARCFKECVWRGLPLQPQATRFDPVDDDVEELRQTRGSQDSARVAAGRNERSPDAGVPQPLQECEAIRKHLDSGASQVLEEQPLLAGGKSANGVHAVGLARTALREGYAAGGQKRAHAVDAGPAIHVRAIVPVHVEGRECLA